jgi:hypothetical protein
MKTKIIICKDCGCEMEVTSRTANRKRCNDCNKLYYKNYQKEYQRTYVWVHEKRTKNTIKRTYSKRTTNSIDEVEYCKNNWNSIEGCLNCPCADCIQQIENDTLLPWENEGFYEEGILNG